MVKIKRDYNIVNINDDNDAGNSNGDGDGDEIGDRLNIGNSGSSMNLMKQTDNNDVVDPCRVIEDNDLYATDAKKVLRKFHDKMVYDEDVDDIMDDKERAIKTEELSKMMGDKHEMVPPENFSHVVGEIYRSSFPRIENFPYLQNQLKLKSILVLIPEEYPPENLEFLEKSGIRLYQVGMSGNKEPFVNIPSDLLTKALEIVINPENHPILIHCNRGKHRTGCLIGCIRKLQNWSLTMIFDEYRRFAFPKARALDQQFIELYDDIYIKKVAEKNTWLPLQW
ncbi:hypothetical protein Kpol_1003p45 [Vanderwaltozyma polyspora DSM 70294]|uniref:diphosphoinositol-polyphosphate diphosphatase n=1 Tax=Vanderwaltozyma polyspora (strain ATCC 22028 / DSM 70294 / BCRC 21397 / CBS 2163 / NBRC 10782 / NRRL Y-8283 / UCD 57-17) TaxID=436907 RepID=A7TM03_VANPO|nr:uncharacterized protein Kpol_1003p45 [Vanderwaltozyma polyspora DSM 70294]EDO16740.1 hypothetical protein Kpol_1003p45 [Vanderwaltozyma polyspora DSM 70294]